MLGDESYEDDEHLHGMTAAVQHQVRLADASERQRRLREADAALERTAEHQDMLRRSQRAVEGSSGLRASVGPAGSPSSRPAAARSSAPSSPPQRTPSRKPIDEFAIDDDDDELEEALNDLDISLPGHLAGTAPADDGDLDDLDISFGDLVSPKKLPPGQRIQL